VLEEPFFPELELPNEEPERFLVEFTEKLEGVDVVSSV